MIISGIRITTESAVRGFQSYNLGINSKASVPGGEVHTYGSKFQALNGSKVIMDRNLGATATSNDGTIPSAAVAPNTFGFFYQWGRKDPLPRWSGVGTIEDTKAVPQNMYAADGTTLVNTTFGYNTDGSVSTISVVTAAGSGNSLAYLVKNPVAYIANPSVLYDWYTASTSLEDLNNNLWGSNASKGAYDPCPKGWRVAPNGTWDDTRISPFQYYIDGTAQTAEGTPAFVQSVRNGRLYTAGTVKAWFPASGLRSNANGTLCVIGCNGYYWSSSILESEYSAYHLYFDIKGLAPQGLYRRTCGFSVRCIQE